MYVLIFSFKFKLNLKFNKLHVLDEQVNFKDL